MSRIAPKNTQPELAIRQLLFRHGLRFRLNDKRLPGTPDIVLGGHSVAVFVHGCFWHRHQDCRFAYSPKTNVRFWNEKFAKNVERDKKNVRQLRKLGWRVVVVWECQVRRLQENPALLLKKVMKTRKATGSFSSRRVEGARSKPHGSEGRRKTVAGRRR